MAAARNHKIHLFYVIAGEQGIAIAELISKVYD
ncbi:MAG: hypothetical protein ACI9V8_001956 [Urechidicola sp.]|jgi:hypothetical protein